jgi:putative endonuclease
VRNFVSEKNYYVYIMTNKYNTVLYTGVTNDLLRRVYQHREKLVEGFTRRYNVTKLIYYEVLTDPQSAIVREKQIKAKRRQKKIKLIESMNPSWKDLWEEVATF